MTNMYVQYVQISDLGTDLLRTFLLSQAAKEERGCSPSTGAETSCAAVLISVFASSLIMDQREVHCDGTEQENENIE